MGQTPSSARQDNASTRTLHSSSINSRRPMSFFRRISHRLNHPRRFGRHRPSSGAPRSSHGTPTAATAHAPHHQATHARPQPSSASYTSSVRHATAAATRAAAAATGPALPPLAFLSEPSHLNPPTSSAASTASAISNASELSQVLSEIITSAVLAALPTAAGNNNYTTPRQDNNSNTNSNGHSQNDMPDPAATAAGHTSSNSFFRYLQMPLRPDQHHPQQQQQQQQDNNADALPQRFMPILIVGYRTSSTDTTHGSYSQPPSSTTHTAASPPSPPTAASHRPRSTVSTSSSLATLQSMPLSMQSNRTGGQQTQQQQQQQQQGNGNPPETGQWVVYVLSGHNRPMTGNPTYEDLLWLSNLIGPARPVTTTQAAIDAALPVIPWSDDTKHTIRGTDSRCLVCLDDFVPKQSVRVLKCCHVFHKECVDRWLCETHNSCPVCRGTPVEPQSNTTHPSSEQQQHAL
ncbi:hypothetical protein BCR43DRAFT_497977 [Syncephalastrum racemosum]|uniref:RING-type domain-containing protein n=1 Tax=Syncephalastrum racemosum TaxID=13706 RepID=A0A1X2H4B1_SYNRA|nr:hypothetical protein BCR43DRAFT_497977 [Syncephalastrum racemosum]